MKLVDTGVKTGVETCVETGVETGVETAWILRGLFQGRKRRSS